jgi:hypothetical protein
VKRGKVTIGQYTIGFTVAEADFENLEHQRRLLFMVHVALIQNGLDVTLEQIIDAVTWSTLPDQPKAEPEVIDWRSQGF